MIMSDLGTNEQQEQETFQRQQILEFCKNVDNDSDAFFQVLIRAISAYSENQAERDAQRHSMNTEFRRSKKIYLPGFENDPDSHEAVIYFPDLPIDEGVTQTSGSYMIFFEPADTSSRLHQVWEKYIMLFKRPGVLLAKVGSNV